MSVARHLGISLSQYDRRIRTFIPHYEEILEVVAGAARLVRARAPVIVDLGIGTGALAARCLTARSRATLIGLDADAGMLDMAARRLNRFARRIQLIHGSFARTPLPRCDMIVATLALHHIRSERGKRRFYRRCFRALRAGGVLASGDAFMAADSDLSRQLVAAWLDHMARTYGARRAREFLRSWAKEDRYFPLEAETAMLRSAGFRTEVVWRKAAFGVVLGRKRP